jgi:hypothetical protein
MGVVLVAGLRCRDQWYSNRFLRPSFKSRTFKDEHRLVRGWRRTACRELAPAPFPRPTCSQWRERARARSQPEPFLGVDLATPPLRRHLQLLVLTHCKPHLRIAFPVTRRALRLIDTTTSHRLPLSLIHSAAHIEAANAEPNPPDPDTPLKHPHIPPTCPTPLPSSPRLRPHRASSLRATSVSTASPPRLRRSS